MAFSFCEARTALIFGGFVALIFLQSCAPVSGFHAYQNEIGSTNAAQGGGPTLPGATIPNATPPPEATVTPAPTPRPTPDLPPPRASTAANLVACPGSSTSPGIDVSDYDAGTQWTTVQKSGRTFAFIKATEGLTFVNPYFASDWVSAKANGILRGAYHFFHPADDPTAQAQFFLKTMAALAADDLPPMFDWESTDGQTASVQISGALTFLNLVEQATGKTPIVYLDADFFNALGNPSEFEHFPLYIAHYNVSCPSIPPPWSQWLFWQTGTGPAAGVQSSQADLDVFNGPLMNLQNFSSTGLY